MHLCISVYQSFVLHLCLSAVYKSSVLHLDVFAYMSPVYAIPGGTQFTNFFVCFVFFETVLFFSVVSIRFRNTETNRKIVFFCFTKQTEKQPKQIVFRFFSVQTKKIYFVCFEDTLLRGSRLQ
jgi:hypothetical protein